MKDTKETKKNIHLEDAESIRYYDRWIRNVERSTISTRISESEIKFSVVIPVYNAHENQLRDCIDSVLSQTYRNYELILVEDCSTWTGVVPTLKEYEGRNGVKIIYRTRNGNISVATNDGISASDGDFIVFMDCDDTIPEYALNEIALMLDEKPELDFIYTDEDKITEDGKIRHMPYFKPDWSPDLFFCMNYTNHLSVFRASIVKQMGGLRSEYNGSQDYDLTLRFLELTDNKRIGHIPKILYHWREREESVAFDASAKSYAFDVAKEVKADAIKRRGLNAKLEYIRENSQYRVVYETVGEPLVSIVIPSKDHPGILKQCIDSINAITLYKNYEIIVVDNGSSDTNRRDTLLYLAEKNARYIYGKYPFNFSAMCNIGANAATGEYILFLNDDIEIFQPQWLQRLLGQAMQPHTGAVGAKLYYPGTTIIQHGGVISREDGPGHILFKEDDTVGHYFGCNLVDMNYIAVTGACLMLSKKKFEEAGRFDESLPVAYNDVSLCYALAELGYYNTIRNDVVAYHHESFSRGSDHEDDNKLLRLGRDFYALLKKYPQYAHNDPFLNPNLAVYGKGLELSNRYEIVRDVDLNGAVAGGLADINERIIVDWITIRGWSFIPGMDTSDISERFLLLEDPYGRVKMAGLSGYERMDVKEIYQDEPGALMSGFECVIRKEDLRTDVIPYHLGVLTIDKNGNRIVTWCGQSTPVLREGFPSKRYCGLLDDRDSNACENNNDLPDHDKTVIWGFDDISRDEYSLFIEGYSFVDVFDHFDYETIIEIGDRSYNVQKIERVDVAAYYLSKGFLFNTGFRCIIMKNILPAEGNYEILIRMKKKFFEKEPDIRIHTGKFIDI